MRSRLAITQHQYLSLTPQLQQAIRLLQLSNQSLALEIEAALSQNPFLELESETEIGITGTEIGIGTGTVLKPESESASKSTLASELESESDLESMSQTSDLQESSSCYDSSYTGDFTENNFLSKVSREYDEWLYNRESDITLHQHLLWQLNIGSFSEKERLLGSLLIDGINDEGYLSCDLKEIQNNFTKLYPDQEAFSLTEIEIILYKIQHFEPLGVGSRTLIECLCLQLSAQSKDTPLLREALHAVQYLELIAKRDFQNLKKRMKWDDTMLQSVLKILKSLHPKPGHAWLGQSHRSEYVLPDLWVRKKNGIFVVQLNMTTLPKIQLNAEYASWVKRADTKNKNGGKTENNKYSNIKKIKEHYQEAKNFINSIKTRNHTLLQVAKTIVEHQQNFFSKGAEYLVPLKLHEISEKCDLHESTVSRVTTHKFMDTPRGLFELKYFFSNTVNPNKSAKAIQAWMKKILATENKNHPLSDEDMTKLLFKEGIRITRRTVTKYREKIKIPSSHERRSLNVFNNVVNGLNLEK